MSRMPGAYLEARTAEIRDAAMRVFARKGINVATMQDIASEAGISAGAIYRYFPGKDELVRAVFDYCREENGPLYEGIPAGTSPLEALLAVGRSTWDEFRDAGSRDRYAVRLAAVLAGTREDDPLGGEMRTLHGELLGGIEGLVREAQAAGELRRDIDAPAVALTLLACVHGLQMLFVEFEREIDPEGAYEVLVQMLRCFAPVQEEV